MSVLVTPEEMRRAERAAIERGTPEPQLMRRAAEAIAAWVARAVTGPEGRPRRAAGLVGPGNNGGDAIVALALLAERGWECAAVFIGRAESGKLPISAESIAAIRTIGVNDLARFAPDVILDGIFGIGGRAELPEAARSATAAALAERTAHGAVLVALDVPSGADCGSGAADEQAFRADVTLCLGLPKIGLIQEPAATHVGELVVVDIGIEAPITGDRPVLLDASQARELAPRRAASAHKSTVGSVMMIGGASIYYGAPRLAGEAALRAGAGLVAVAAPKEIVASIATQVPELTYLPLTGDGRSQASAIRASLDAQAGRFGAFVIGPGLGHDDRATSLLEGIFAAENRHIQQVTTVLDADGLNWLAGRSGGVSTIRHATCVLTPHPGEMARLRKCDVSAVLNDPIRFARDSARAWEQVVVLKSGYSVVAAPDERVWVAPRAMPELATAGTGDVLSGLIGGLLAQGLDAVGAARLAMFVGAMAGRRARADRGIPGVVARDVIDRIDGVLRDLTEPSWDAGWMKDLG